MPDRKPTTLRGAVDAEDCLVIARWLERHAIATVPVTVEYSITQLGVTLAAAVDPLRDWAEQNLKDVLAAQRRYDAQLKDEAA